MTEKKKNPVLDTLFWLAAVQLVFGIFMSAYPALGRVVPAVANAVDALRGRDLSPVAAELTEAELGGRPINIIRPREVFAMAGLGDDELLFAFKAASTKAYYIMAAHPPGKAPFLSLYKLDGSLISTNRACPPPDQLPEDRALQGPLTAIWPMPLLEQGSIYLIGAKSTAAATPGSPFRLRVDFQQTITPVWVIWLVGGIILAVIVGLIRLPVHLGQRPTKPPLS